uniref:Predicted protein n=1 Tax=Hordeum vulgare subsp. vulgare TaxID=112509 RepID=F2ECM1_HORVV|nr:predicted protein [Hordeum vulgare subsp. vulgare]
MASKYASFSTTGCPTKKAKKAADADTKEALVAMRRKCAVFFPSVLLLSDLASRSTPVERTRY